MTLSSALKLTSPTPSLRPRARAGGASMLAIEIYFYGLSQPQVVSLPPATRSDADSYFQRLKAQIIDAQRHGIRRIRINPIRHGSQRLAVAPLDIQRLALVDRTLDIGEREESLGA